MKKIILLMTLAVLQISIRANTCSIGLDAPINFGNYDPLSNHVNQVTAQIKVNCQDASSSFSISLAPGNSQNFQTRKMQNGKSELNYNLYLDPAATIVWGDGCNGSQQLTGLANCNFGSRCSQNIPIYAQIFPQQLVTPGQYSDTINITVNY